MHLRYLGSPAPPPLTAKRRTLPGFLAAAALLCSASLLRAQPSGLALSASFAAVTDDGGGVPPDPQGAAGPEYLLTMTNTRFAAQSKNGAFAKTWSPAQFWASVSQNDLLFDPRVMYDSFSNRWIAVMATESVDPALLLAISDGTDPTQGWTFYRIPADSQGNDAAEFPLLGGNGRWICLTANLISLSTGESGGVAVWAIEKAPLLSAGTLDVSRFVLPDAVSPVAPVATLDADQPDEFLLEQWSENNVGHGQLELSRVTDVGGIVKLKTVATISAASSWVAHPNPFDALPQKGTTRRITASRDDVASACLRHGAIWAAQTATIPAAGSVPEHSVVQWWRVTPAGALSGFGRIGDAAGQTWLAYPSVAVNARDQVVIGYSIFSPQAYPSAGYSIRTAGGCDGQLARIHTLEAGLGVYVKPDSTGLNRWGDLSETVVDPQDDLSIWTIQEYAAAPIQGASRWGTWWGGFSPAESGRENACIAPAPERVPAGLRTRISSGPR